MSSPAQLNELLTQRSYVSGYTLSGADTEALVKAGPSSSTQLIHYNRWASHVTARQGSAIVCYLCLASVFANLPCLEA